MVNFEDKLRKVEEMISELDSCKDVKKAKQLFKRGKELLDECDGMVER